MSLLCPIWTFSPSLRKPDCISPFPRTASTVFVTGHAEYDADTLKNEYERDIAKGMDMPVPRHYFPDDNPPRKPIVTWRAHANLLYANWLNYYVYQETPFDLSKIAPEAKKK